MNAPKDPAFKAEPLIPADVRAADAGAAPLEPIAILGIGCRLPGGADGPAAFWQMLRDRVDAVREVPADRWNAALFHHPDPASRPGTIGTRMGGFMADIDKFDPGFFGISPREAQLMDPQQRLLLEAAVDAIEDAGLGLERLDGSETGVFIGIAAYDYAEIQHGMNNRELISGHTNTGLALSIAANRISYLLNLKGPSVAVDTACSSSLVALHLACQSLRSGESRMAIVGGVNAILKPEPTIGFSRASMLSPDGRCKTFDARANGYTRGEGAGIVVLKPLSAALADGDPVYAVIRATVVNQDGHTNGMTVPGEDAQARMLATAYARAGVVPGHIQYMEAHGTGTPVGDPIEARALGRVLAQGRPAGTACVVGSVKTNIGHLEAAAGIAGLIKATLALHHRRIPSNLNFQSPNPAIDFDGLMLRVATEDQPWPENGHTARAGVNSFGFGGTNAHAVLEAAPPEAVPAIRFDDDATPLSDAAETRPVLLPVSARGAEALSGAATALADALATSALIARPLADIAAWAGARRSQHDHRLAVIAADHGEAAERLRDAAAGTAGPGIIAGRGRAASRPADPVFVFSGMGPQWWAMGRQLIAGEPLFRATIEECDALLKAAGAPWSLMDEMLRPEAQSLMAETYISQPSNFALQVGLARLWRHWGIRPSAIVGHSTGEAAAAHVAGQLDLATACTVIYHRSRVQQRASGKGRMLAAALTEAEALERIAPVADRVSIAAMNGPGILTLAGDAEPLEAIAAGLAEDGRFNRFLTVAVPFHSHHMDPLRADLEASLAAIRPTAATTPLYSTVTGARADDLPYDAAYWWRNVRQPVRFADAIRALIADGHDSFLEIGPHPVISSSVDDTAGEAGSKVRTAHSLRRQTDERSVLLTNLAQLYTAGHDIDWLAVNGDRQATTESGHRPAPVPLPAYAWQHKRYWQEAAESLDGRVGVPPHPFIGRKLASGLPLREIRIDLDRLPFLADHAVGGSVLFPGAGFIEAGIAAWTAETGSRPGSVEDIRFLKALILGADRAVKLQVALDPSTGGARILSRPLGEDDAPWALHATMTLKPQTAAHGHAQAVDLAAAAARCDQGVADRGYGAFTARGLAYGPAFQGIAALNRGAGEALARIVLPDAARGNDGAGDAAGGYTLHPSVLDACFQAVLGAIEGTAAASGAYLPVAVERLRLLAPVATDPDMVLNAHARLLTLNSKQLDADIRLTDATGRVLVEVQGFTCMALDQAGAGGRGEAAQLDRRLFAEHWVEQAAGVVATDLPAPADLVAEVTPLLPPLVDRLGRAGYYAEAQPLLDRLTATYANAAFTELGADPAALDVAAALADTVDPVHHRLLARLAAVARAEGEAARVPPESVLALIEQRHPELEPELVLIRRCGAALARVLTGAQDPLDLIFPDGAQTDAERVYRDSRSFGTYNLILEQAVRALVDRLPADRAIRVLEIGAGTGATAAHLLPALPSARTDYVFTDISTAFTAKAEQKFRDHGFVRYRLLDIEKDPAAQGFAPASFDLVIATDSLHATRAIDRTLGHATGLLRPGGLMALVELTAPPPWFDLVFGMLKGWWAFDDAEARPTHACMALPAWEAALARAGCDTVAALSDRADGGPTVHSVILARRSTSAQALPVGTDPIGAEDTGGDALDSLLGLSTMTRAKPGWLVLGDGRGVGAALARSLEECGHPVLLAGGEDARRIPALIDRAMAALPEIGGIVHLWSLDAGPTEAADMAAVEAAGAGALLDLVKSVTDPSFGNPPRLVVVTAGARRATPADPAPEAAQAPAWGFARVLTNEHPELGTVMVDLSAAADGETGAEVEALAAICAEGAGAETEITLRGARTYVARIRPETVDSLRRRALDPRPVQADTAFRLNALKLGALDNLMLTEITVPEPGPDEVEIAVAFTGLNFRDVMKVMGIYPTEGDEPLVLGDEVSGHVVRVGPGVTDLVPGDRVIAIAPGFASRTVVKRGFVARLPDGVALDGGATIPITFVTVWYALHHLARAEAGERILIHAAAGGVGLTAIQVAKRAGLEIHATAGSPEKRAFIRGLGVTHIYDSRSLDFADQIMEATGGEGVDMVLNSLAGEAIPKSLGVLRAYGRFLEIGKTDIYGNSRIGLRPFRNNLSYFAIDLDRVFRERPKLAARLMTEVAGAFAQGTDGGPALEPLPRRVWPVSRAEQAFRHMAQARHIGKIVLDMADTQARIARPLPRPLPLKADGTYLLTGGLGGFGLAVADWLVARGAGTVVLAGRSGAATPEAQAGVDRLRSGGARVRVERCDITDRAAVDAMLARIRAELPPLRGVLHAAMVLDDDHVLNLDRDRLARVTAPKVQGALNLHLATRDDPIELFMMFSSFAAMVGNPGQANYVAANQYLVALAERRRAQGLPALVVDWGAIGGVGYVAAHDEIARHFERHGLTPVQAPDALAALEALLGAGAVATGVIDIDWAKWARYLPEIARNPRYGDLPMTEGAAGGQGGGDGGEQILAQILDAAGEDRPALLQAALADRLATVLGTSADALDTSQPLADLGLDSLMAVELSCLIEDDLGVKTPAIELTQSPSLSKLTERLLTAIAP